ncbi:MAG: tetratricopeptide repeat protein [Elusimicrobia bacterium]|nr:tetratricopeptide repeat protein [Elusimicrobiota bacterium]
MRRWLEPALLAAAVAAGFANSLPNGFSFDDRRVIVENPKVTAQQWAAIWTGPCWFPDKDDRGWRPLTAASFALDWRWHGPRAAPFRVNDLLLHAANSALVVRVAAAAGWTAGAPLAAGLLFALHPIHTEVLNPIVGRADLLAALFMLLCCWAYGAGALPWALACFGLGLLAKESAVSFLFLLPVYALRQGWRKIDWRRLVRDALLFAAVLAGYMLLRDQLIGKWLPGAGGVNPLDNPLGNSPLFTRVSNALYVTWRYVLLLVVPWPLSADYAFDSIPVLGPLAPRNLAAILLLAAAGWGLWRWSRRQPQAGFAAGFFLAAFLLVSNIPIPIGAIMAERFAYLPSVGFCLLAALALQNLGRRAGTVLLVLLLAVWAGLCIRRNRAWRSDETLFVSILETSPRSVRGMVNAGQVRLEQGRFAEARDLNLAALSLKPLLGGENPAVRAPLPYSNLGIAYMRLGDLPAAEAALQEALKRDPQSLDAWVNLGIVFAKQRRLDGAINAFEKALALAPEPAAEPHLYKLYYNLALAMKQKGEFIYAEGDRAGALALFRQSSANYEKALELKGDYAEARAGLQALRLRLQR